MKKIKFGVIGLGNQGTHYVVNLFDKGKILNGELVAVCDSNEKKLETLKGKTSNKQLTYFNDYIKLLDSGLCDAVLVETPHYQHPEIVIACLKRNVNVICDKPAGVYTQQVKEMNEVAQNSKAHFAVLFNQRMNSLYRKMREMILNGEIGDLQRVTWIITDWYRSQAYHNSSTWRSTWATEGGGALINQNPHQLDLWQWIFGVPDRVFAKVYCGKYHDIEVEDDVMAFFEYDNGTTGEYITSTGEAPGTNRLEVACDMGKVVIENNKMLFYKNEISEREFEKINTIPFGKPACEEIAVDTDFSGGEQHVGIFKNVVAAINEGAPLLAPLEEGIKGLTISNAIHLSGWTGETIELKNFPDDRFYDILQEKIKSSTVVKVESKVVADTAGTY